MLVDIKGPMVLRMILAIQGLMFISVASAQELISSAPGDARAYFIQPADGQVIETMDDSGVEIIFGLTGMDVSP